MSDTIVIAYLQAVDKTVINKFINTLNPCPDETAPIFFSELTSIEVFPKFDSIEYDDEKSVILSFTNDGFLASETIGEIAFLSGLDSCFVLERSDIDLFMMYERSGHIELIYSNDDNYEFVASKGLLQKIESIKSQGGIAQLRLIANSFG